MTDELTKLARAEWLADTLDADDIYINLRIKAHHAAEKAKALILELSSGRPDEGSKRIIAALDALILTPPVDPLEREAVELVLASKPFRTEGQRMAIRQGLAGQDQVALALAALRRGLELREGGGA